MSVTCFFSYILPPSDYNHHNINMFHRRTSLPFLLQPAEYPVSGLRPQMSAYPRACHHTGWQFFLCSDNPIHRAFHNADRFQSRSTALTWNSAQYCKNTRFFCFVSHIFHSAVAILSGSPQAASRSCIKAGRLASPIIPSSCTCARICPKAIPPNRLMA